MSAATPSNAALRDLVAAVDQLLATLKTTGRISACFWLPALETARKAINQTDDAGAAGVAASTAGADGVLRLGGQMVSGSASDLATHVIDKVLLPVGVQLARRDGIEGVLAFYGQLISSHAGTLASVTGPSFVEGFLDDVKVALSEALACKADHPKGMH
jgi:hypothetical protein